MQEGYPKMLLEVLQDIDSFIRSRECSLQLPMRLYRCAPQPYLDDSDVETDGNSDIEEDEFLYGVRTRDGDVLCKNKSTKTT